jgi:HK97 family phage major capsid protein
MPKAIPKKMGPPPGERQYRSVAVETGKTKAEERTVELAFSSETPVVRWWGIEVLSHDPGAMEISRMESGGPVLMDHNTRDLVGVVEECRCDEDKKGRAVVRFSKSVRAEEVFQDILDGIRKNVSVGYDVNDAKELDPKEMPRELVELSAREKLPVYRISSWTPMEISMVAVPADPSVGVGRSEEAAGPQAPAPVEAAVRADPAVDLKRNEESAAPQAPGKILAKAAEEKEVRVMPEEKSKSPDEILAAERARVEEINALCSRHNMPHDVRDKAIREGASIESFRGTVLERIGTEKPLLPPPGEVGMSKKEDKEYSIVRALLASATGDWSKASFELEVSRQIAKRVGKESKGFFLPTDLQVRAPLSTTVPAAGGATVQTTIYPLIELLRNRMMVRNMGASVFSGLSGNVAFPRQTAAATLYWTGEVPGADVTESEATFDQAVLTPKTAQATTAYSRQLLAQASIDIESFVRNDLVRINALGLDLASINGSGSANQPRGILNQTGIGSVAGGTNGAAPGWSHVVGLESSVAIANADLGELGYLTNTSVRGKLKQVQKATYLDFIWKDAPGGNGIGEMNGYKAGASNQVPANLTKGTSVGVCSAILFGNWTELLIGEWGVLELITDPYAQKKKGNIEVTSFIMADINVRHAVSFAAMVDALTT